MTSEEFKVSGGNSAAPFTLKLHRGDGMALIAMNWMDGEPPQDFVGFAIEYKEPGGAEFFPLKNRQAPVRPTNIVCSRAIPDQVRTLVP